MRVCGNGKNRGETGVFYLNTRYTDEDYGVTDVAEVLVFDSQLSDSQRAIVFNYL